MEIKTYIKVESVLNLDSESNSKINSYDKNNDIAVANTDTVQFSENVEMASKSEWDIAQKYNIEAMTEEHMISLAQDLKDAGLITADEHAVMSFPREKARERLGVDIDFGRKHNYLKENKEKLDYMLSSSFGSDEIKIQKGIYMALQRLSEIS